MNLDQLIAELIAIRAARPEAGTQPVLLEQEAGGPEHLGYVSAVNADGDGPVKPESHEAVSLYLAVAPEMR